VTLAGRWHVDHAVQIAGVDHGAVRFDLYGLEDCAKLPALTEGLLRLGYDESDAKEFLGENVLRVMAEAIGE
jgi:microsomal dipeptidase-like Zn-dependent dipeptidase